MIIQVKCKKSGRNIKITLDDALEKFAEEAINATKEDVAVRCCGHTADCEFISVIRLESM